MGRSKCHLHGAIQKSILREDVEFDLVYIEPMVSMVHHMAIPGNDWVWGEWNLESIHQGMVAQGAMGGKEVKQEKCVDKERV